MSSTPAGSDAAPDLGPRLRHGVVRGHPVSRASRWAVRRVESERKIGGVVAHDAGRGQEAGDRVGDWLAGGMLLEGECG
jgi:hypothetical protein